MTDPLPHHDTIPTTHRRQFSLRTLILLVAVVACWVAWRKAASDVEQIKRELPGLRRATRELIIQDASQFAAVEKPQIWPGELRWEVYVPEGRRGHVHLALEGITGEGYPSPTCSVAVQSGTNFIQYNKTMTDDGWRLSMRNGDQVENLTRSKEWVKRTVFTNYVQRMTECISHTPDTPLDLLRMRLRGGQLNTEDERQAYEVTEVAGELIWIELD